MLPIDELNAEISELIHVLESEKSTYGNADFLIDLLASSVITMVEEQLNTEYDQAFTSGLDGWLDIPPDENTRHDAIYAVVGGMTFAQRIAEYADGDLTHFISKVKTLLETDGHRVRSAGKLIAGEMLADIGLSVNKTWRGVLDKKERDAHIALEGVTLPVDGLFEIDGYTSPAPGLFDEPSLDCNCRCELEISVIR